MADVKRSPQLEKKAVERGSNSDLKLIGIHDQVCPLGQLIPANVSPDLYHGALFVQWEDEGVKCQETFVRLDRANHRLYWQTAGQNARKHIDVRHIKLVLRGRLPKDVKTLQREFDTQPSPDHYLSIYFGDWPWVALHLVLTHLPVEDAAVWHDSLTRLIEALPTEVRPTMMSSSSHNRNCCVSWLTDHQLRCLYTDLSRKYQLITPLLAVSCFSGLRVWRAEKVLSQILSNNAELCIAVQCSVVSKSIPFKLFSNLYVGYLLVQREDICQLYFDLAARPSCKDELITLHEEEDEPDSGQLKPHHSENHPFSLSMGTMSSPEDRPVMERKLKSSTRFARWKKRVSGLSATSDINSELLNHLDGVILMSSSCAKEQQPHSLSIEMFSEFLSIQKDALVFTDDAVKIARRYCAMGYNKLGEDFSEDDKEKVRDVSLLTFGWYLLCEGIMGLSFGRKKSSGRKSSSEMTSLKHPLSHYFFASSHNTYLTGHQLFGLSAVDMYIQVLHTGCRCVEVDCWDGDTEPIIYHGRTLVSKIPFKDVIIAISEHAFAVTPYPLVISIENHCSLPFQLKMAAIMREYLGPFLLTDKLLNEESLDELPSPEELRYRILLKHARLRFARRGFTEEDIEMTSPEGWKKSPHDSPPLSPTLPSSPPPIVDSPLSESMTSHFFPEQEEGNLSVSLPALSSALSGLDNQPSFSKSTRSVSIRSDSMLSNCQGALRKRSHLKRGFSTDAGIGRTRRKGVTDLVLREIQGDVVRDGGALSKAKESSVAAELSDLVICEAVKFIGFKEIEWRKWKCTQMISVSEVTAKKYSRGSAAQEFSNFNTRQLSRVYPSATRIDSSNFAYCQFWRCGCHMVALNYQTMDAHLQCYLATFEQYNNSGYFLKPKSLRMLQGRGLQRLSKTGMTTLNITVVSGQLLPTSSSGYTIDIEIYGRPEDNCKARLGTATAAGPYPLWPKTASVEFHVRMPEIAVVRLTLLDEKSQAVLGHALVPIPSWQPGYRHIPLECNNIPRLGTPSLFVFSILRRLKGRQSVSLSNLSANLITVHCQVNDVDQTVLLTPPEDCTARDIILSALTIVDLIKEAPSCGLIASIQNADDRLLADTERPIDLIHGWKADNVDGELVVKKLSSPAEGSNCLPASLDVLVKDVSPDEELVTVPVEASSTIKDVIDTVAERLSVTSTDSGLSHTCQFLIELHISSGDQHLMHHLQGNELVIALHSRWKNITFHLKRRECTKALKPQRAQLKRSSSLPLQDAGTTAMQTEEFNMVRSMSHDSFLDNLSLRSGEVQASKGSPTSGHSLSEGESVTTQPDEEESRATLGEHPDVDRFTALRRRRKATIHLVRADVCKRFLEDYYNRLFARLRYISELSEIDRTKSLSRMPHVSAVLQAPQGPAPGTPGRKRKVSATVGRLLKRPQVGAANTSATPSPSTRNRTFSFGKSTPGTQRKKTTTKPGRFSLHKGRRQSVIINDNEAAVLQQVPALGSPHSSPEIISFGGGRRRSLSCGAFFEAGSPFSSSLLTNHSEAPQVWSDTASKASGNDTESDGAGSCVEELTDIHDDLTGIHEEQMMANTATDGENLQDTLSVKSDEPSSINWVEMSLENIEKELQQLQMKLMVEHRELEKVKEKRESTQSDDYRQQLYDLEEAIQERIDKLKELIDDLQSYC